MPAPNPTNRERLLRLIDGGTDALKELQSEETATKPEKPSIPPDAKKAPLAIEGWKAKLPHLSGTEVLRLAKWLIALAAIALLLHYGLEMLRTMKQPAKTAASSSAAIPGSPEDASGIGLRLVGVDTSDASPVALLEDLATGKTYFARVNEKVKNARVKQIQKNKVSLSFRGKNVELR